MRSMRYRGREMSADVSALVSRKSTRVPYKHPIEKYA